MRRIKVVISGILAALLALSLVGCQASRALPAQQTAAVVLVGHHDNSQKPQFDALTGHLKDVYDDMGCASMVLVDGEPSVFRYEDGEEQKLGHEYEIPTREEKYKNRYNDFRKLVKDQLECFEEGLDRADCIADDPQVDTLKALEVAVAELNSIMSAYDMEKETTNREILVCDTGLCTTGELDFSQPELNELLFCSDWSAEQDEELDELVKGLECGLVQEEKLKGVTVIWYGLGQTGGKQGELPYWVKTNLKEIWTAVLKAAGVQDPQFEDGNWGKWDPEPNFEEVTRIEMPVPPTETTETRPEVELPEENKILFNPGVKSGVNTFVDPEEAKETLIKWTKYLQDHPDERIVLVGTTTSEEGDRLKRSSDRIQMVIDTWKALVTSEEAKKEGFSKDTQTVDQWIRSTNPEGNNPGLCTEEDEDFDPENRAVWIFTLEEWQTPAKRG